MNNEIRIKVLANDKIKVKPKAKMKTTLKNKSLDPYFLPSTHKWEVYSPSLVDKSNIPTEILTPPDSEKHKNSKENNCLKTSSHYISDTVSKYHNFNESDRFHQPLLFDIGDSILLPNSYLSDNSFKFDYLYDVNKTQNDFSMPQKDTQRIKKDEFALTKTEDDSSFNLKFRNSRANLSNLCNKFMEDIGPSILEESQFWDISDDKLGHNVSLCKPTNITENINLSPSKSSYPFGSESCKSTIKYQGQDIQSFYDFQINIKNSQHHLSIYDIEKESSLEMATDIYNIEPTVEACNKSLVVASNSKESGKTGRYNTQTVLMNIEENTAKSTDQITANQRLMVEDCTNHIPCNRPEDNPNLSDPVSGLNVASILDKDNRMMQVQIAAEENIFEGFGQGTFESVPKLDEISLMRVEEEFLKIFKNSDPDEDDFVQTRSFMSNVQKHLGSIGSFVYESIGLNLIEEHERIDFRTFFRLICEWYQEIIDCEKLNEEHEEIQDLLDQQLDLSQEIFVKIQEESLTSSARKQFPFQFDEYRRSTLLPWNRIQTTVNDVSVFPSPIKSLSTRNNEGENSKWGRDPIELQEEVLELTHTNKKLIDERDVLTVQYSQAEQAQLALREKCESLEEALSLAQHHLAKLKNLEEENLKLRLEIEKEIKKNLDLQNSLTHCQQEHENLLNNFKVLEEQFLLANEKLEMAAIEKNDLSKKIDKYCIKIDLIQCEADHKLTFKETKIQDLQHTINSLEATVQEYQEENLNLMSKLQKFRESAQAKDVPLSFKDELLLSDSEDSGQAVEKSLSSDSSSKHTESEIVTSSSSIYGEICSMNSTSRSQLPFCEKGFCESPPDQSSPETNTTSPPVTNCDAWSDRESPAQKNVVETLDQDCCKLFKENIDEHIAIDKKWSNLRKVRMKHKASHYTDSESPLMSRSQSFSSSSNSSQYEEVRTPSEDSLISRHKTNSLRCKPPSPDPPSAEIEPNLTSLLDTPPVLSESSNETGERCLDTNALASENTLLPGLPDVYLRSSNVAALSESWLTNRGETSSSQSILSPDCGQQNEDLKILVTTKKDIGVSCSFDTKTRATCCQCIRSSPSVGGRLKKNSSWRSRLIPFLLTILFLVLTFVLFLLVILKESCQPNEASPLCSSLYPHIHIKMTAPPI